MPATKFSRFIRNHLAGRNGWWYLLGILLPVFLVLLVEGFAFGLLDAIIFLDGNAGTYFDEGLGNYAGIDPSLIEVLAALGTATLILGVWLSLRLLHRRGFRTAITATKQVRWSRMAIGFVLWLGLLSFSTYIYSFFEPAGVLPEQESISFLSYGIFLMLGVFLVPLQTTSEEIYFRGYLLPALSNLTRRIWLGALLSSGCFALVHFASFSLEWPVALDLLYFFGVGLFLSYIVVRDNGLEQALGIHAANNLFWLPSMYGAPMPGYEVGTDVVASGLNLGALALMVTSYIVVQKVLGQRRL